jgi:eukaryotic-like serine/threonine-protein kinase
MNSIGMIKGRYKLIDEIESGSFGTVFIARDMESNILYAAKIMHPEHARDSSLTSRFQREAYILQGLSDPHIVRIIDYGNDGDVYYIIEEFVDGQSLKYYITTSGRIEPLRALNYTKQIAEGLEAAHKHGVVHRDIKPQNILINNVGVVKITDFGMARGEDSATITGTDEFMGTPYYISPEQVDSGHLADTRSDLYSLAIVLFEMLTGRPPFEGGSIIDIVIKQKKERVPSVCRIRPNLPADMDVFFQKALAKTPASRFQTPHEFISALEQLQKQVQASVSPPHMKVPVRQGYLIVLATGQSIPLTWELMMVGRQDPKVGIFPEINLTDMKVGRRHAYLRNRQGTFTIEDLNSTNKTRLNGVTLLPNQEYPLNDGDLLRFGSVEVRFELH